MYKKILVPTDGSDYSRRAFEESIKIAELTQGEVIVLHVVDTTAGYWSYASAYGYSLSDKAIRDLGEVAISITTANLEHAVPVTTKILSGNPTATILDEIEKENIDLIVMGSHGKGFIKGSLLGSVSNRVVQLTPCPVLITK